MALTGTVPMNGQDATNGGNFWSTNLYASGEVGVGTDNPSEPLEVSGDARVGHLGINSAANANMISAKATGYNVGLFQGLSSNGNPRVLMQLDADDDAYFLFYDKADAAAVKLNTCGDSYFTGGNVGIGTNEPTSSQLEVSSDAASVVRISTRSTTSAGDARVDLYHDDDAQGGLKILETDGTQKGALLSIQGADTVGLRFFYGNTEGMRMDGGGQVGIGDTDPDAALEVVSNGTPFMVSSAAGGDGDWLIVTTNGDVGIGQASPDRKMEISDSGNGVQLKLSGGGVENASIEFETAQANDVGIYAVAAAAGENRWELADGSIHVAHTTHNVGIGTNGPDTALEINGALTLDEMAEPDDPADGKCVIWFSNGTGAGSDGDLLIKRTVGGTVTTNTIDLSAL